MYLLGYDIGSSSIKAALVDIETGSSVAVVQLPENEMSIEAPESGWAEQDPGLWWHYICLATQKLLGENNIKGSDIKSIGIAYQMHGLVMLDSQGEVIRPSIIWCDSRAVQIGQAAFDQIGQEKCLKHMLNSPGNFTASKLRWVLENEPKNFARCHKIMLPGDYIAYKLSGEMQTTTSGLSEGVLWDFQENRPADLLLDHYDIPQSLLSDIIPSVGIQAKVSGKGAAATGLAAGTPISYRAGDQPNNALALNVLNPGEVAATGGTSGVVYGVVDKPVYDPGSRVNGFAHINHTATEPRIGILLCINGAGIQYGWLRKMIAAGTPYVELEKRASGVPIGSDGLLNIPFGNGAERMLENIDPGAQFLHLQLNRHGQEHLIRATLEGIAFSFVYGMEILKEMKMSIGIIKVGNDNLFQSDIFSKTISTLTGATIQMLDTTGAIGAALASGVGSGVYSSLNEAMSNLKIVKEITPDSNLVPYRKSYSDWKRALGELIARIQ